MWKAASRRLAYRESGTPASPSYPTRGRASSALPGPVSFLRSNYACRPMRCGRWSIVCGRSAALYLSRHRTFYRAFGKVRRRRPARDGALPALSLVTCGRRMEHLIRCCCAGVRDTYALTRELKRRKSTRADREFAEALFHLAGYQPLAGHLLERRSSPSPADREVVCHAQRVGVDSPEDCAQMSSSGRLKISGGHHELGHNYYDLLYASVVSLSRPRSRVP